MLKTFLVVCIAALAIFLPWWKIESFRMVADKFSTGFTIAGAIVRLVSGAPERRTRETRETREVHYV